MALEEGRRAWRLDNHSEGSGSEWVQGPPRSPKTSESPEFRLSFASYGVGGMFALARTGAWGQSPQSTSSGDLTGMLGPRQVKSQGSGLGWPPSTHRSGPGPSWPCPQSSGPPTMIQELQRWNVLQGGGGKWLPSLPGSLSTLSVLTMTVALSRLQKGPRLCSSFLRALL